MIRRISNFIKRSPRLFDSLRRVQRVAGIRTSEIYKALDSFSRSHNRSVSFIQIGASDGLRNDPIREFIVRDHWHGLLVEPLPGVFDILLKNYSGISTKRHLKFINCAITSESVASLTIWSFDEARLKDLSIEDKLDLLQKSSLNRSHLDKFIGTRPASSVKAISVPCLTFTGLIEQFFSPGRVLDLLVLDVEGQEWNIIHSIDFDKVRPEAIFYESRHLAGDGGPLRQLLRDKGYEVVTYGPDDFAHTPKKGGA